MAGGINPLGSTFLSYRTADGYAHAERLAWALRATGVPVWHDETDLPPGDTTQRLREALDSGLAGAALVVTPDIKNSTVVRQIEVPSLLRLAPDPEFTFLIASVIEEMGRPGHLDLSAPDRLLDLAAGTLSGIKQYDLRGDGAAGNIAREFARRRMAVHRGLRQTVLKIDIQTRLAPQAEIGGAGLIVRTRPPTAGRRAPSRDIWGPLNAFLEGLPQLVEASGAERLHVRGGAHLTVAFALGSALPTTTPWPMTVEGSDHRAWDDATMSVAGAKLKETVEVRGGPDLPVAVFVDLVPTPVPVRTLEDYLQRHAETYQSHVRIEQAEPAFVPPGAGSQTANEIADLIRHAAANCQVRRVDLFLRVPFPMAVLLGRRLNTLELTLYEWEDGIGRPRYVPTVTVASGRGGGPILRIHDDEIEAG